MRLDRLHGIVQGQHRILIVQQDGDREADITRHSVLVWRGDIGVVALCALVPVALRGHIIGGHIEIRNDGPVSPGHIDIEAAVHLFQHLCFVGVDKAPDLLLIAQIRLRRDGKAHGKLLGVPDGRFKFSADALQMIAPRAARQV